LLDIKKKNSGGSDLEHSDSPIKRKYQKPQFYVFGLVSQLTTGGSDWRPEQHPHQTHKQRP